MTLPGDDTFSPPDPAPGLLQRRRTIDSLLRRWRSRKVLLILAQAGQGKSTLAVQLLRESAHPFLWYRLTRRDEDPAHFLSTLLGALSRAIPGFHSPRLQEVLSGTDFPPQALAHHARILSDDLGLQLNREFSLVFDDVHHLRHFPTTSGFIESLAENRPPWLKLLLIGRLHPFADRPFPGLMEAATANHHELALTGQEIADLLAGIPGRSLSEGELQEIARLSEGWMTGVLLLGEALKNTDGSVEEDTLLERAGVFDFFRTEVFEKLPRNLRSLLLKLSLLETVTPALAQISADPPAIGEAMGELAKQNCFLRRVDAPQEVFFIHPLFRAFLQKEAQEKISAEDRCAFLNRAAAAQEEANRKEEALELYLRSGNYPAAQKLVPRLGFEVLNSARLSSLGPALERLPENIEDSYPWLCYARGVVCMERSPPHALHHLQRALQGFVREGDDLGELLAVVHTIFFHLCIDARFRSGVPLLRRAESLYHKLAPHLNAASRAWVTQILAGGFGFCEGKMRPMEEYSSASLQEAAEAKLDNLLVGARVIRCYMHLFMGKWDSYRAEIEALPDNGSTHQISPIYHLFLRISRLNLLVWEGDFFSYSLQAEDLRRAATEDPIARTIIAPWILVWDVDLHIARGRFDAALDLLRQGLEWGEKTDNPHLIAMHLQYRAYLHALAGEKEECRAAVTETLRRRETAGGEWFALLNETICGGALALGGDPDAGKLLQGALERSRRLGEEFLRTGIHAHLALLALRSADRRSARKELRTTLRCLRKNRFTHLRCLPPFLLEELLREALREEIEIDYARKLAVERLERVLLPEGDTLPLMKIRTLGALEIEVNGTLIPEKVLSAAQREILTLLLTRPDLQLRQEEIQCHLWPDSPPERSRSSLDTLLSRLRATLDPLIRPLGMKSYLTLSKGILRLENCRIDNHEFRLKAQQGLHHARKKEFWQAGNAFRAAFSLWRGPFLPESAEDAADLRETLAQLHVEAALAWSRILERGALPEENEKILTAALRQDRTNEVVIRRLYHHFIRNDRPRQAAGVLEDYRKALAQEGYSEEEIERVAEHFWIDPE